MYRLVLKSLVLTLLFSVCFAVRGISAEPSSPEVDINSLRLRELSGFEFSQQSIENKKVVIYFWSIYCRGCIKAMDELENLRSELAKDGVELLTVHLFETEVAKISSTADRMGIRLPILLARNALHRDLEIRLLPTSLVFDSDHRLVSRIEGVSDKESLRLNIVGKLNDLQSVAAAKRN